MNISLGLVLILVASALLFVATIRIARAFPGEVLPGGSRKWGRVQRAPSGSVGLSAVAIVCLSLGNMFFSREELWWLLLVGGFLVFAAPTLILRHRHNRIAMRAAAGEHGQIMQP